MNRRTFLSLALVMPACGHAAFAQPPRPNGTGRTAGPTSAKLSPAASPRAVPWTQWGGPHRNFQTEATGLKETWPASGPRVVFKRSLGEGDSSMAVENNGIYTMYGKPRQEVVLAVNAESGQTLWEHVWGPDNLIFISSEYNGGAKVIELQRNGMQTTATEL
jgi:outer membrane protein assembly factor BamB